MGDCELKLGEAALLRVRKEVDWSKGDAKAQLERLVRVMGAEYVNAYRKGGNAELAVYRDSDRPTFVANEFREMVNVMPELSQYLTGMREYLLEYPKPVATPTASFIYWQEAAFGLKPTIRIGHVAIQEGKDADHRRVQAALLEPLFLDCPGAARSGARIPRAAPASGS